MLKNTKAALSLAVTHSAEAESSITPLEDAHPFAKHVSGDVLNLSRQNLTCNDIKTILSFLQDHLYISKLDLSLNHIGDQGLSYFAERNHSIFQLDMSGNNVSDMGLALFGYKNLVVVRANFSHNRITDDAILNFAETNQNCIYSQFSPIAYH